MKSRFNLATKPLVLHRKFYVLTIAAIALSCIAMITLSWKVYAVRKADASFRGKKEAELNSIQQLQAEREELERFFAQPENAKLHERAEFINTILDARSFNWTHMFMDLEKVVPVGVRVLNIEPKRVNGQAAVKLTVGAVSEEAKQRFMDALERTDTFSHLQLVSVRPTTGEQTTDILILELTIVYSRA